VKLLTNTFGIPALCRRVQRCRRGIATVELALISPVFFLLLLAVIETSIFYFKASMMEGAVTTAVRGVMTGQDQSASGGALSAFNTSLCNALAGVISCGSVVVSMNAYANFSAAAAAATPTLFDANGNPITQGFNPGTGNQVVIAVVGYRYKFLTPMVGYALSPDHSGTVTATAAAVFLNEPF
jgi:Flp pilus assembly protein TadG